MGWNVPSGGSGLLQWVGPLHVTKDTADGTLWPELVAALVPGAGIMGVRVITTTPFDGTLNVSLDGSEGGTAGTIQLGNVGYTDPGNGSIIANSGQGIGFPPFWVVGDASSLALVTNSAPSTVGDAEASVLIVNPT